MSASFPEHLGSLSQWRLQKLLEGRKSEREEQRLPSDLPDFPTATSKGMTRLTPVLDGLSHSVKGGSSFPPDQRHQLHLTRGNTSND